MNQQQLSLSQSVSLCGDVPDDLFESLTHFVETHPDYDFDRVLQEAIATFLMNHQHGTRAVNRIYLQSLFPEPTL